MDHHCKNCIYHKLAQKKLMPGGVSLKCRKYGKLVKDCPDKVGAGIESLNRTKDIVQKWVDLIKKMNEKAMESEKNYSDSKVKTSACERCKQDPLRNPNFGLFCRYKEEWISDCVILKSLSKKSPPFMQGRPKREQRIMKDDVTNLKILLNTCNNFEKLLECI